MAPQWPPDAVILANVEAYREHGFNVTATARALGMPRQTLQSRLRYAVEKGLAEPAELHDANPSRAGDYVDARDQKIAAYERRKREGNWTKPVLLNMPAGPCILALFGDPHVDNDGSDFAAFEAAWMEMEPGVWGICVGDWFDNWPRALAHLYKENEGRPSTAWTLLDGLMDSHGEWLLAACSGNHDDWTHAPVDPVAELMRRHGVVYRKGAVRLALNLGGRTIMVSIRHKWQGRSMYSAAHGLLRATRDAGGIWDHLLVGGHIHQDEDRMTRRAHDGFVAHLCQLSSFKAFDRYTDVEGFADNRTSPVRYAVVDPRRADNDPDLIRLFYDPNAARRYRDAL